MQIKVSFTGGKNFDEFEKKLKNFFNTTVRDEGLRSARANTPINTGRARKAWTAQDKKYGFDLVNAVPYIGKLERGSSRQAPTGILKPTAKQLKSQIRTRRIIR